MARQFIFNRELWLHLLFLKLEQRVHVTSSDGSSSICHIHAQEQSKTLHLEEGTLSDPLLPPADEPLGKLFIGSILDSVQALV